MMTSTADSRVSEEAEFYDPDEDGGRDDDSADVVVDEATGIVIESVDDEKGDKQNDVVVDGDSSNKQNDDVVDGDSNNKQNDVVVDGDSNNKQNDVVVDEATGIVIESVDDDGNNNSWDAALMTAPRGRSKTTMLPSTKRATSQPAPEEQQLTTPSSSSSTATRKPKTLPKEFQFRSGSAEDLRLSSSSRARNQSLHDHFVQQIKEQQQQLLASNSQHNSRENLDDTLQAPADDDSDSDSGSDSDSSTGSSSSSDDDSGNENQNDDNDNEEKRDVDADLERQLCDDTPAAQKPEPEPMTDTAHSSSTLIPIRPVANTDAERESVDDDDDDDDEDDDAKDGKTHKNRKRKKKKKHKNKHKTQISSVFNVRRDTHVEFDRKTGTFRGLPAEWQQALCIQFGVSARTMPRTQLASYNEPIPNVLIALKRALLKCGGLNVEGIFRVAPDQSRCTELKQRINAGMTDDYPDDPHVLATLIKQWYRDLPSPVLSTLSRDEIARSQTDEAAWKLVEQLPEPKSSLLLWLLDVCVLVCLRSRANHMTEKAMAIVVAPNLQARDGGDGAGVGVGAGAGAGGALGSSSSASALSASSVDQGKSAKKKKKLRWPRRKKKQQQAQQQVLTPLQMMELVAQAKKFTMFVERLIRYRRKMLGNLLATV